MVGPLVPLVGRRLALRGVLGAGAERVLGFGGRRGSRVVHVLAGRIVRRGLARVAKPRCGLDRPLLLVAGHLDPPGSTVGSVAVSPSRGPVNRSNRPPAAFVRPYRWKS